MNKFETFAISSRCDFCHQSTDFAILLIAHDTPDTFVIIINLVRTSSFENELRKHRLSVSWLINNIIFARCRLCNRFVVTRREIKLRISPRVVVDSFCTEHLLPVCYFIGKFTRSTNTMMMIIIIIIRRRSLIGGSKFQWTRNWNESWDEHHHNESEFVRAH